jgi:selenium metabolism protein YedF
METSKTPHVKSKECYYMKSELDCRGLACPAPVLQTKRALDGENPKSIKVIVDNEGAKQNVTRFLENQKFEVSVEQSGTDFYVHGKKTGTSERPDKPLAKKPESQGKKIMVMVGTDRMGHGDDVLGSLLLFNFLKTLKEMGPELWRLVFVNSGVKLATEGAQTLSVLKDLEGEGATILVCGTCLTHFSLLEKKKVGETTNMLDIVTAMQVADSVINI